MDVQVNNVVSGPAPGLAARVFTPSIFTASALTAERCLRCSTRVWWASVGLMVRASSRITSSNVLTRWRLNSRSKTRKRESSGWSPSPRRIGSNRTGTYLLPQKGVYILESLDLEARARDRRWEFAFVGIPLKLHGATGSPLRPLALVEA
jgi:hypothetical protein